MTNQPFRWAGLDLARGIAVCLMILSHGIKGLLGFEQIPSWGLVPIHLVTKTASTLFFMVFGMSLAVSFLPYVGTKAWPQKRKKLLLRGVLVLFWYKVLTAVEMAHLYSREEIVDALLYKGFPVYSEILGFYAIALLWIPFALPVWARLSLFVRWGAPFLIAIAAYKLHAFEFWGLDSIKAILVEHERFYTWGQLSRLPVVLLGVLAGQHLLRDRGGRTDWVSGVAFGGASLAAFAAFLLVSQADLSERLVALARNEGKHPPELEFALFSSAGAFAFLALVIPFRAQVRHWLLRPFCVIGRNALQAFVFHLVVIFVIWRMSLGYWRSVSYEYALFLTAFLMLATIGWNFLLEKIPRPGKRI